MTGNVYQAVWISAGHPVKVRWRDLSYREYRQIAGSTESDGVRYMRVYRICLVDGPTPELVSAGIATWIGRQQLQANPFSGEYSLLKAHIEQARTDLSRSYLRTARGVISWAFHYTFEEIDQWPPSVFFERLAQAEFLLGTPLEPADPKAPAPDENSQRGKRSKRRPQQRGQQEVETQNFSSR